MNAEQKRQLQAEFSTARTHTDNDNAKPDYRRIKVAGDNVELARRAWLHAAQSRTPGDQRDMTRIWELDNEYRAALAAYVDISEEYWGRR